MTPGAGAPRAWLLPATAWRPSKGNPLQDPPAPGREPASDPTRRWARGGERGQAGSGEPPQLQKPGSTPSRETGGVAGQVHGVYQDDLRLSRRMEKNFRGTVKITDLFCFPRFLYRSQALLAGVGSGADVIKPCSDHTSCG